jgi:hypothetical protein
MTNCFALTTKPEGFMEKWGGLILNKDGVLIKRVGFMQNAGALMKMPCIGCFRRRAKTAGLAKICDLRRGSQNLPTSFPIKVG